MKTGSIPLILALTILIGPGAAMASVSDSDHPKSVHSVAFNPDGWTVAGGSEDGQVKVFDIESGRRILILPTHKRGIEVIAYSPNGKWLAAATIDNTVEIWDAATGKLFRTFDQIDSQESLAFSPDSKILAGANRDITLWSMESGEKICKILGTASGHQDLAFSRDGKLLVVGGSDKTIKLWDLATKSILFTLSGHQEAVEAVAISPDGKTVASGSSDQSIKLWNAVTGKELMTLAGHKSSVCSLAFSPDGKTIVSASYCDGIRLWDTASGKQLRLIDPHSSYLAAVAFSPDGKTIVAGTEDTIKLFKVATGQELHRGDLVTELSKSSIGHNYIIYKGCYDASLPTKFVVQRPDKSDSKIALCIPAAFVGHTHDIDGAAVVDGEIVNSTVDYKIGGAALLLNGDYTIFGTASGEALTQKFLEKVAADKASVFQQFQVVKDATAETFKDTSSLQRRALVVFNNSSKAIVESQDKVTLSDFATDLVEMSVQDALYTDMGDYDEGWFRQGGTIKTIGQTCKSTANQNNWLVFERPAGDDSNHADHTDEAGYVYPLPASRWLSKNLNADRPAAAHSSQSGAEAPFTAKQLKEYYNVYQMPDIKYLRSLFSAYLKGAPAGRGERRSEYQVLKKSNEQRLRGKFIVLSRSSAVFGGTNIKLLFQDHPDKVLSAWVYTMNPGAKHPEFSLRAMDCEKYSDHDLKAITKRYRQFILDKVHAI